MKFYKIDERYTVSEQPGIYRYLDKNNQLLYIGKAKNLKKRVLSYFQNKENLESKTKKLVEEIARIEVIEVLSEFEALLLEAKLIRDNHPKYNILWKDDKHYIYIAITREKFPRLLLTRKNGIEAKAVYGPFPSTRMVKEVLSYIRHIFPYCTQKETTKRACFYTFLQLCNPCPASIKKLNGLDYERERRKYLKNINSIRLLLSGKSQSLYKKLTRQMSLLSKKELFEEAAEIRNRLRKLNYLLNHYHTSEDYLENLELTKTVLINEGKDLLKYIQPYFQNMVKIERMECYDISNINGTSAVGSMVTFINGIPDKKLYRRFKIRLKKRTPDDFAMISEIIKRRLNHPEWKLPDLMVIDGGTPQLIAVKKVFKEFKIRVPFIGLAKMYDEIVILTPDDSLKAIKVRLKANNSALKLVQRLRDEAHRFAHKYHTLARLKNLLT